MTLECLHPDQAARKLLPFTAELDLCQRFITICTSDALPSMDLTQATSICLYETAKAFGKAQGKSTGRKKLATGEVLEGMYGHMKKTLLDIGHLDPQNPDHIMHSFPASSAKQASTTAKSASSTASGAASTGSRARGGKGRAKRKGSEILPSPPTAQSACQLQE